MSRRVRLYLITPPAFERAAFSRSLEAALSGGDVACVQLRLKDAPDAEILSIGAALKPIVQAAGAASSLLIAEQNPGQSLVRFFPSLR